MAHIRIKRSKEVMNIITIYNAVQGKEIEEILETIENYENESIITDGDFNIRIKELRRRRRRGMGNS